MASTIKRVKVVIAYNGANYIGFQKQSYSIQTIQGQFELALKKWYGQEIETQGSGRTDAKVHALGQVISFTIESTISERGLKLALNNRLPNDIRVTSVDFVNMEFHARYHAISKTYHYLLNTKDYDVFNYDKIYQYCKIINVEKLQLAAQQFIGVHDFYAFCKNEKHENTIREVNEINIHIQNEIVCIEFIGKGFLRHMVRNLVETLLMYERNKITLEKINHLLYEANSKVGYCAAPEGLYLVEVKYDTI